MCAAEDRLIVCPVGQEGAFFDPGVETQCGSGASFQVVQWRHGLLRGKVARHVGGRFFRCVYSLRWVNRREYITSSHICSPMIYNTSSSVGPPGYPQCAIKCIIYSRYDK